MITSIARYQAILEAARRVPQNLLDAASTLLPHEPEELVERPEVAGWFDDAYGALPLAAQAVERVELASYLKDRLCVHLAVEAVRAGASHETVIELLWPADLRDAPRSGIASTDEAAVLWPVLKEHLRRSLARPPWDGIVEIYSSDHGHVAAIQPDPPEHLSYFRSLASMGYDKLDDRFCEAMECGAMVELGWVEANVVPALPPAGAFAYVALFHADRERLLALVDHASDAIAFAALTRLEQARRSENLQRAARELRATIAGGRAGPADVDELARRVAADRSEERAFHERLFAVLAGHPSRFGHRLTTFMDVAEQRDAAVAALRSIPAPELESLARVELARATARGDWRPVRALVEAIDQHHPQLYAELLSTHEAQWRSDPGSDTLQLPLLRAGLLFDAFRMSASNDVAAFRASTNDAVAALLRRLQGRFLGLDFQRIDEVLARLLALANLHTSRQPGSSPADFTDALELLRRLMARWRGLRSDFLDLVTTNLLGAIDLSDASERAAGVALLRAAAGNEVLCHLWASWLPGEPGLRVSLVSEAHVAFLHTSALFLANTTRNVSGEDSLYTVLLETGCAECETIALRRLHELRGAIAPLAEAILDRNATVVHRELQRALGFSLLHEARQRLRRSLIDVAARWMGVRVDESAFAWARQLEGTGLVDNGNEWHLRRP